jgi:hypothetical protein
MKTPIIRVSLAFGSLPDNTSITFARSVLALLYTAAGFTDIPVTAIQLEASIDAFAAGKAAQANGGPPATAEKNDLRAELVKLLKQLAFYVQVTSDNNLAMVLSTGFLAVSTNRAPVTLAKPSVQRIVAGMAGEALVTISSDKSSRGTEVRVAEIDASGAPGPYRPAVASTSSRNISILDLVPGQMYAYQGRNFGGSTTYSDWSDVRMQRAF